MQMKYWLTSLAWLPLAAGAQQAIQAADPADARATVPPLRYESAFNDYRGVPDEEKTPDHHWRAVNDAVRNLGGHAGHLKAGGSTAAESHSSSRSSMPPQHGKHH